MKIGILTYHAACNFGANLQALSTVSYLIKNGHTPIVINWFSEEFEQFYRRTTPLEQLNEHLDFREKYLPLTERCYTDDEINTVIKRYKIEAIIVGSDAVAQHHPFLSRVVFPCKKIIAISTVTKDRMCPNPFWGSFFNKLESKIPMAMMSVSSQNSEFRLLTNSEKKIIKKHISNFNYISTRDEWTSEMFYYITKKRIKPDVTPDPVFAFNHNVDFLPSKEEVLIKFGLPSKYYLFSFYNQKYVDCDWLSGFERLSLRKGIACIALSLPQGIKFKHPFRTEIKLPLSPLYWYALIKYSQGYIGNNMHPIIVSLHNGIPCFSFDNWGVLKYRIFPVKKSSKTFHIMEMFGCANNYAFARGLLYKPPTPEYVFEMLQKFNPTKVLSFSEQYQRMYLKMMKSIIHKFISYY